GAARHGAPEGRGRTRRPEGRQARRSTRCASTRSTCRTRRAPTRTASSVLRASGAFAHPPLYQEPRQPSCARHGANRAAFAKKTDDAPTFVSEPHRGGAFAKCRRARFSLCAGLARHTVTLRNGACTPASSRTLDIGPSKRG